MISNKDLDHKFGKTDHFIKENIKMVKNMEKENIIGKTVLNLKVNGLKIN